MSHLFSANDRFTFSQNAGRRWSCGEFFVVPEISPCIALTGPSLASPRLASKCRLCRRSNRFMGLSRQTSLPTPPSSRGSAISLTSWRTSLGKRTVWRKVRVYWNKCVILIRRPTHNRRHSVSILVASILHCSNTILSLFRNFQGVGWHW